MAGTIDNPAFWERKGPNPIEDPEGYRIYKRAQLEESIRVGGAMKPKFFVGVDVGRRGEFTAIAIVEQPVFIPGRGWVRDDQLTDRERRLAEEKGGGWRREYELTSSPLLVRDVYRLLPGASYPDIWGRVEEIVQDLRDKAPTTLVVNATGAGHGFMKEIRSRVAGCDVREVVLTKAHRLESDRGVDSLPIKEIAETLRILFDSGEITIARAMGENKDILVNEFKSFTGRIQTTEPASTILTNWREGERDDLVLAVGLACFWARLRGGWSSSWGQTKRRGSFATR